MIRLLLLAGLLLLSGSPYFQHAKRSVASELDKYSAAPKNITLAFIDITNSDTSKAWVDRPFRKEFINIVNSGISSSDDVLAVFFIHGRTVDEQPFWTNFPLATSLIVDRDDSASLIMADVAKRHCLERFDSVVTGRLLANAFKTDSMLIQSSDLFGALQQAALYFRRYNVSPKDGKRVFLLSDAKENGSFEPEAVKLNNISTIETARKLARSAFAQISRNTDIRDELKYADIHILTPNNRLYYNNERNVRRIFWETFFYDLLHCNKVYFF